MDPKENPMQPESQVSEEEMDQLLEQFLAEEEPELPETEPAAEDTATEEAPETEEAAVIV